MKLLVLHPQNERCQCHLPAISSVATASVNVASWVHARTHARTGTGHTYGGVRQRHRAIDGVLHFRLVLRSERKKYIIAAVCLNHADDMMPRVLAVRAARRL